MEGGFYVTLSHIRKAHLLLVITEISLSLITTE